MEAIKLRSQYTLQELPNGRIVWKYDVIGIKRALDDRDPAMQVDLWPAVRSFKCPTLLIRGTNSKLLTRKNAEAMVQANPNICLVDVQGATHFVHEEQPDMFNREVEKFLSSLK